MIKFFFILLISATGLAELPRLVLGNELGNGGDVIQCETNVPIMNNQKIMVLDLYVARWKKMPVDFEIVSESEPELLIAQRIIQRLRKLDPDRFDNYMRDLREWNLFTINEPGWEIPNYPDHGSYKKPIGYSCKTVQIAAREEILESGDPRYIIKNELFELLDQESKAGLILHEIIYRRAILADKFNNPKAHENSRRTKKFLALLANPNFGNMNPYDYEYLLTKKMKIPAVRTIAGLKFDMGRIKYAKGLIPTSGWTSEPGLLSYIYTIDVPINTRFSFYSNGKPKEVGPMRFAEGSLQLAPEEKCELGSLTTDATVGFYQSGVIASLKTKEPYRLAVPLCFDRDDPTHVVLNTTGFSFHENGMLKEGLLSNGQHEIKPALPTGCDEVIEWLKPSSEIVFYDNGFAQKATMGRDTLLCTSTGGKQVFESGTVVEFNDQGLVENWDFNVSGAPLAVYLGGNYED